MQCSFNVVPVKDLRSVHYLWPMESTEPHYRTKPVSLLGHLLGHEGKGSLLSFLKRKGWANALSAGPTEDGNSYAIFSVSIELTVEGLGNVD